MCKSCVVLYTLYTNIPRSIRTYTIHTCLLYIAITEFRFKSQKIVNVKVGPTAAMTDTQEAMANF